MKSTINHKQLKLRVNVTLPPQTIRLINRVTEKGSRSQLVDEAVRFYIKERARRNLRKRLKLGASGRTKLNLKIAQEWFPLEEEVWQRH